MSLNAKPIMVGQDDVAAPTIINAYFLMARAEAAADPVDDGDSAVLSTDLNRNLRVTMSGGSGTNPDAIHTSFNEGGSLAAGTSTVTFRTVTAGKLSVLKSVIAAYTGTVAGVTLQLIAGGVAVWLPVGGLVSGQFVPLIPPGLEIPADAAETYQVTVTGATLNDDLDVRAHFLETDA